jgi:hypothetical protein
MAAARHVGHKARRNGVGAQSESCLFAAADCVVCLTSSSLRRPKWTQAGGGSFCSGAVVQAIFPDPVSVFHVTASSCSTRARKWRLDWKLACGPLGKGQEYRHGTHFEAPVTTVLPAAPLTSRSLVGSAVAQEGGLRSRRRLQRRQDSLHLSLPFSSKPPVASQAFKHERIQAPCFRRRPSRADRVS